MAALVARAWSRRELLWLLTAREIRGRYLGNAIGWFWLLIHPLALLAVYGLVFSVVLGVRFPGSRTEDFPAFLALGLWPWLALQEGTQRAAAALEDHRDLLRKAAFPREFLIYSAVLGVYTVHGLGFLAVIAVLAATGAAVQPAGVLAMAGLWGCQALLTAGLGLALAPLQLVARDLRHALPTLFTVWFFATPIVYPTTLVPLEWRPLLWANPATHLVQGMRSAALQEAAWPPAMVLAVAAVSLLVFVLGGRVFRRCERWLEDFF